MRYKTFADFIAGFDQFSDRTALTIKPFLKIERLNYSQLQTKAYQVAHYLAAEGLKSGQRIMIVGPNSPQWVSLFLGAQLVGVIVVPVDVRSGVDTARKYIQQTNPKLIFRGQYTMMELDSEQPTRKLETLFEVIANQPDTLPKHPLSGEETALIVFTSGTTAEPKGVVLTQANILSNVSGVQAALHIDPNWRLLSVLPLSHMYELTGGCLAVLSGGCNVFYLPRVTPLAIARGLHDYQITTLLAVPQLLTLFLQRIRQTAEASGRGKTFETALRLAEHLPFKLRPILFHEVHKRLGGNLEMVVTGGAPIPHDVAVAWERMGVKTVQGYGLTETSPVLAVNNPMERRLDSQGRILQNVKLRLDPDSREIQAKGESIFSGYWHNQAATEAAFTKDGWFKTGDIGSIKNDWLQIQGREKFTIVLASGLKVFPEDIELVADRHPEIPAVCIVGRTNPDGEQVVAVVASDKPDTLIQAAIASINDELEPYQHISDWLRWPTLDFPRTRLLKVDRRAVQAWANDPHERQTEASDNSKAHDSLIGILRLTLDKPTVSITDKDSLADLGLDSLRRLVVVSLIEEQLGITVPESQISDRTTVAELRRLIEHGDPAESAIERPDWPFRPWVRVIGNGLRETLVRGIVGLWVRQHSEGDEQLLQSSGPKLYIFNHVDDFDAPVTFQALPSAVRNHLAIAMADDVIKDHKMLAFIARLGFASFNFARHEPYMPSLEYLAALIDKGWNVALSPEGRISKTGKLQPFKTGIGLLAVELGVPVVVTKTVGLFGTVPVHSKWPKKHARVTVRISEPVFFDKTTSYKQATETLHTLMEQL